MLRFMQRTFLGGTSEKPVKPEDPIPTLPKEMFVWLENHLYENRWSLYSADDIRDVSLERTPKIVGRYVLVDCTEMKLVPEIREASCGGEELDHQG